MPVAASSQIEMLRQMILIREFEEAVIRLRTAGKIYGVVHPYTGQEAIAVGVCATLTRSDRITSTHRGHGHCIAKGADLRRMMAELYARVDGYCKGKGGSMHIADFSIGMLGANGVVGAGLPMAAGAALAAQLDGRGDVAVCFFGDGAVTEGEFHEALNISAVWDLPCIFVCENNLYASNNAIGVQHRITKVAPHADAYGMPGVTVDGNDVLAVHEAAAAAVERARKGQGPSLIECNTYRWYFHSMHDTQPPEKRPAAEVALWKGRDPIVRLADALLASGGITGGELEALRTGVLRDLEDAIAFADASPFPDPAQLLEDMYAPDPVSALAQGRV